jgi:hypothetical protein
VQGNTFSSNSNSSNGAYDEIYFEGYADGFASQNNNISNNTIIIPSTGNRARYAVNEGTANDGPNIIFNNIIPNSGISGVIHQLCLADVLSSPGGVLEIGDNSQSIQGTKAGLDSAFSNILRLYNNFPNGSTQIVAPNGSVQFYVGGNNNFNVGQSSAQFQPGVAITAGGSLMFTTGSDGPNVYTGSGVPVVSNVPQGSLYLRSDGNAANNRLYVMGDVSWIAVATAS